MGDTHIRIGDSRLAQRLRRVVEGEVRFDAFTRGRYSTDASIYQVEPIGVLIPKHSADVLRAIEVAAEEGVPILPRGAGTSQAGQTVGRALVIDSSRHLTSIGTVDVPGRSVLVEPGVVLDRLNAHLRPHGLFFPVDVATAAQATLGGMAGNNSAGARSIRYGLMADNVRQIDAVLADGTELRFGPTPAALADCEVEGANAERYRDLVGRVRAVYARERDELSARIPGVLRHVAGYNLHRMSFDGHNMAELLVGSEGTLAFFTALELKLAPLPANRALGVCHFPQLRVAMDAVPHIVALDPTAVELVDETLLALAGENPVFARSLSRFVQGTPGALLLVEFSGNDEGAVRRALDRLTELLGDLGYPKAVVHAVDPAFQQEIWSVRKAGLSIVMSLKGDRKPVSFVEDCAVPLERLGEYTDRLAAIFAKHGTSGTFYAHASVGCLHIRPALNLKDADDVATMRTIADEAHQLVAEFKGSHSGEHGDGIVRSEFLEPLLGRRLVHAFEEVKQSFDPRGLFNPGKIVSAPRMDDRTLMRYKPGYAPTDLPAALDWSTWGGWLGAVEMCNNNGACRKHTGGVMCPSYRVTESEEHVTRGRANSLRLALTGQLGGDALSSADLHAAMDLCVGCKACRSECPAGVDMARMKIEFLHHYRLRHGLKLRDRLTGFLPRWAQWAARFPRIANAPHRSRFLAGLGERLLGFTAKRPLPEWRRDHFREPLDDGINRTDRDVVMFVDTFSRYFEPENVAAAGRVLQRAGYRVRTPVPAGGDQSLCCGRTFLNVGLVDEAKREAKRVLATLAPAVARGTPVVGLEPSCLLTLRDELPALLSGEETSALARAALLLEEFVMRESDAGRWRLSLNRLERDRVLLHGHCHQKAFGTMEAVERTLGLIPGLQVIPIESGCCGMAGSFGYEAEHYELSQRMAELDLLPAVRESPADAWIVADGTSCRRQIIDGTGREAVHVARLLDAAI